ncbi:MAG: dihydroneopterin aldolase [Gammaproteobacteria bacterium]
MGTIFIHDLPVDCIIGIHPHERASRQRLVIGVELDVDFHGAAATDDLDATVDYAGVAQRVMELAVAGRYRLIEALAEAIADALLTEPVTAVRVEITKPAALPATRRVGVRVARSGN